MASLEGVLAGIPGLAGYEAARQQNQQMDMGKLQQAGLLQGILAKAREQAQLEAFRGALSKATTPEEQAQVAAQFGTPANIMQHADRQVTTANTKEMALARLQQAAQMADQTFELRRRAATTAEERTAVENQWKTFRGNIDRERLKYDTGASVPEFALPPMAQAAAPAAVGPQVSAPQVPPEQVIRGTAPNMAAGMAQFAQGQPGAPRTVEIGQTPSAPVAAPMAPAPAVAPATPTGPVMPPNIAALPKKLQDQWAAAQAKTASVGQLGPEELGPMAWEKLLFGTNPPGLGNASAAQRQQVNQERARLGRSLGLSDMEMAMLPQDNKVKMKAVDTLTKWGATVGRSAEKLDLDLGVALDYAKRLPLEQLQIVNKGIIAGMKEFNSPDANAYATAINSVRQEYARLMSGPTSNAMLPVEAMKKGNELLSSGVDVPSLEEVGRQMRRDAANTMTATKNGIGSLRDSISSLGRKDAFDRGGAIPEFANEADAIKAGAKGKVKIGGRNATIE